MEKNSFGEIPTCFGKTVASTKSPVEMFEILTKKYQDGKSVVEEFKKFSYIEKVNFCFFYKINFIYDNFNYHKIFKLIKNNYENNLAR